MKKILLIILIGVLIMLKPINAIIKDSLGNIIHRGSVVTGIIATDNGDGSYDVFISESDKAYPKVRTLSQTPDLAVDDKVRILYKDGCRELPIILPPVKPIGRIFVYSWNSTDGYNIKSFNSSGSLITTFSVDEINDNENSICIDKDDNIYYLPVLANWDRIKKIDKDGNLLLSKETTWSEQIAIGPDGYIYVLEFDSNWDSHIIKRDRNSLEIVTKMALPRTTDKYTGFTIDSDSYIYLCLVEGEYPIQKWDFVSGTKIAETSGDNYGYSPLAVTGDRIGGVATGLKQAWTTHKNLAGSKNDWDLNEVSNPWSIGSIGNYFLFGGFYGEMAKYQSDRTNIWAVTIEEGGMIYQIRAYPF